MSAWGTQKKTIIPLVEIFLPVKTSLPTSGNIHTLIKENHNISTAEIVYYT